MLDLTLETESVRAEYEGSSCTVNVTLEEDCIWFIVRTKESGEIIKTRNLAPNEIKDVALKDGLFDTRLIKNYKGEGVDK